MVGHYALLYGFHMLWNLLKKLMFLRWIYFVLGPEKMEETLTLGILCEIPKGHETGICLWTKAMWLSERVFSTYSGVYGSHTIGLNTVYRQVMAVLKS